MPLPLPFRAVLLTAILLAPAAAPAQAPAREAARSAAAAALDQAMVAAVERKDTAGVVVVAADKNGLIYQGAFGLAEGAAGRAMTLDAIFRTASMTKAVTSVAVMQLVEAGKVSLDDPASKYFPEFAAPMVFESFDAATREYKLVPAKNVITVRQLLTHTSGLGYGFTSATLRDFKPRDGEKYPIGPLLFEPGTDWVYGSGVDWAGRLVESLSGQSLEDYFQERIFRPLQMADTSYNVPEAKHARLVNVFLRAADGGQTEQARQAPRVNTRFNGGGGLYSTAGDYIRFYRMFLNGGELDGARILSPATVALMGQNAIGEVNARAVKSALPNLSNDFIFIAERDKWGLGFQITTDAVPGKRAAGSLSWGGINNTFFWIDPASGVTGVIMMQSLPFVEPRALSVYDAFERGVYRLLGE